MDIKDMTDQHLIYTYSKMREQHALAYAAMKDIEEEFKSRANRYKESKEKEFIGGNDIEKS